jgi:IQ calmodulin-binding motif-containing protein
MHRAWRRYLLKKRRTELAKFARVHRMQTRAAIKIQTIYRGYITRKHIRLFGIVHESMKSRIVTSHEADMSI